ncbi:uncharacterized protein LOC133835276 isoform X1 [Drosophila sulfurigaster albostrigata]|uniref:uncharacterized protein LOC133835276 isoform X1 n=1 Tax=Drosophila sulfurigaster albostrigata TaxID=89887 RepID=UPI002D218F76|nr:uncharacterized protein LOC133835276 isoform X1 [Drosophila sulfurigaster albostrigata]
MAGLHQLTVDVSCIKNENKDHVEEEEQCDSQKMNVIKTEPAEETTTDKLWTEIDIGPIKLEENLYNIEKEVEVETFDKESACKLPEEASEKSGKSQNRREIVRNFHQRILQLDTHQSQPWSYQSKSISNAQHMRELRQRLMNLEQSAGNSSSDSNDCGTPSSQLRRELEQRLMDVDSFHRAKKLSNRQRVAVKLPSETEAAQRMRRLRQRRRDLQSAHSNCNSPTTPLELSANRMEEFRQRLLKTTIVAATAKTQKQLRNLTHKKSIGGKKLSKPAT